MMAMMKLSEGAVWWSNWTVSFPARIFRCKNASNHNWKWSEEWTGPSEVFRHIKSLISCVNRKLALYVWIERNSRFPHWCASKGVTGIQYWEAHGSVSAVATTECLCIMVDLEPCSKYHLVRLAGSNAFNNVTQMILLLSDIGYKTIKHLHSYSYRGTADFWMLNEIEPMSQRRHQLLLFAEQQTTKLHSKTTIKKSIGVPSAPCLAPFMPRIHLRRCAKRRSSLTEN